MTAPSRLPAPAPTRAAQPSARPRRIKRGIVAGYIHDISPRHRPALAAAPSTPIPAMAAAVEPHQA